MARTPLFRQLQRTLRAARYSLITDAPVDELVQRAAEQRAISRRSFVGYSGATAAGLMLGACGVPLRSAPRRPDSPVLVVGAGVAGLTAAYRLRQAGVPGRIVEAQNRVGGRMYSLRDHFADGQVAELGLPLDDLADADPRSTPTSGSSAGSAARKPKSSRRSAPSPRASPAGCATCSTPATPRSTGSRPIASRRSTCS